MSQCVSLKLQFIYVSIFFCDPTYKGKEEFLGKGIRELKECLQLNFFI